ncbi:MAG TPA: LL-diaminopimelate aminotransferase [Cyanobacteria bacterium UBA11991]|nr:LL-diaminopimelate aminotransferase [Cyanobacteriota bacterium]MDY6358191.1 LL-diaminopimelate aminotransferase [Cyanobacteriota bacterium]MDY6364755.1 LL-diaminopimelate aminotransferase [Cyanobacteriota bacterium]MDY6383125.1 LL-diaminopimelate aminotransferase [Cyanobacteriota bacterium]HCB11455.1 LL-diaminopimelate aminotransferase [Cyanobacteria bacterium UBA11991]
MKVNENYKNIAQSYLFSTVGKKVSEYMAANPDKKVIKLGIGDVTLPLCKCVTDALKSASEEMGHKETFHGYGPEQGYDFLKTKIADYYKSHDVELDNDEIFVSDGAKSDIGNILDLFDKDNTVLVPDPVYPVYVDTNTMAGRKIIYIDANESNDFLPLPDENLKADIIYICSPNNPTGAVYNKEQLKKWVDFANKNHSIILFDAAYECFISDDNLPRSIYSIDGAKTCAIEFCSFSKMAGFTGTRCGWTVVPKALVFGEMSLNKMWLRRQTTKFNGVSYIVQKGAEAVFTPEGQKQIMQNLDYYKQNAKMISDVLTKHGIYHTGGTHSPYIWLKCPNNMKSWDFFDYLLNNVQIVGTPGVGFGRNGEGFFRLTSFGSKENTKEAVERLDKFLK